MNKWIAVLVVLILIVGIYILIPRHAATPTAPSTALLSFQLTDPPEVPNGTQALVIDYASISAHVLYSNGTAAWVSASGNGSVNLMSIVNLSQIIARTNVPVNSTVDMVRFNVTSAHIIIGNTTYNVTLPNNQVTAHVLGANKINGTASILVDLSPVIATIYTNNSTIFVMVPSVRAVVVSGSSAAQASSAAIGAKISINATAKAELERTKSNISITSATLSVNGNTTSLSVTVKNNENSSVEIRHIMLFGNESVTIMADSAIPVNVTEIEDAIGSNELEHSINEQAPYGADGFGAGDFGFGVGGGMGYNLSNVISNISAKEAGNISMNMSQISAMLNSTAVAKIVNESKGLNASEVSKIMNMSHRYLNISVDMKRLGFLKNISERMQEVRNIIGNMSNSSKIMFKVGIQAQHMRVLMFMPVNNSTTLALPFADHELENEGYTLGAGATATFTFSGNISYANGHMTISPIAGNVYRIVVQGEDGARATTNVTAS